MTSNTPESSDKKDLLQESIESESSELPKSNLPRRSATTPDNPSFGWSGYAERVNGRFAMIGFLAILLIEALSKTSFLHWAGFVH